MKSLYEMKARMITISNLISARHKEIIALEEEKRIILICLNTAREEITKGGILEIDSINESKNDS